MKTTTWESKEFILSTERKYGIKFVLRFLYVHFFKAIYKILFIFVRAPKHTSYRYDLSICAIFKNEARYLKEWIEFHKIIGVDHFYLYNNESDDNYEAVIRPYVEEGTVTLVDFPGKQMQMNVYKDCLKKRRSESHWIALIDIDEFIIPKYEDDIKGLLKKFRNKPVLKLNWNVFGTSGKVKREPDSLVIEEFTQCWRKTDVVGKVLINSDFLFNPEDKHNRDTFHHQAWGNWRGISLPPVNCLNHICMNDFEWLGTDKVPVILHHYFTKSVQEYVEKSNKGDVFFEVSPKTWQYMWAHERYCIKSDTSAWKYLSLLKLRMADKTFNLSTTEMTSFYQE